MQSIAVTLCWFQLKLGKNLHIHGIHQKNGRFFQLWLFFLIRNSLKWSKIADFCQFIGNASLDLCETLSDYSP